MNRVGHRRVMAFVMLMALNAAHAMSNDIAVSGEQPAIELSEGAKLYRHDGNPLTFDQARQLAREDRFNPLEDTPTALNFGLTRKAIACASDTVARVGGDEFVLLLESLKGREDIPSIQEKLYRCCHDEISLDDGRRIPISISVGLALYPDDTQDVKTLFVMADKAMYLDKAASRASHTSQFD